MSLQMGQSGAVFCIDTMTYFHYVITHDALLPDYAIQMYTAYGAFVQNRGDYSNL